MKPPCGRSCSKRSAECKRTCKEWKDYEKKKFEEYEEREKNMKQKEDCIVLELRRNNMRVRR